MYIISIFSVYIHLVKEIIEADVQKNLTLAIIVLQKITRVIVAVDDQSISTSPRNPKNIPIAIIQTLQMTAPIQIIAVILEAFYFLYSFNNVILTVKTVIFVYMVLLTMLLCTISYL